MLVTAIALGTIQLSYKPPEPPPIHLGRPVVEIVLLEPLPATEIEELAVIPPKPIKAVTAAPRGSGGTNTYEPLQCTWWVKQWKPDVPNSWGNANEWDDNALADGWTVSDVPVVGAVAQSDRGGFGHVALVIGVSGSEVTIREGNYDYNGSVRTKTVTASMYTYLY